MQALWDHISRFEVVLVIFSLIQFALCEHWIVCCEGKMLVSPNICQNEWKLPCSFFGVTCQFPLLVLLGFN